MPAAEKGKNSMNTIDLNQWKPVFTDDFDGDRLDAAKWKLRTDSGKDCEVRRGGYWSKDQLIVRDGHLIIRTEYKNGAMGPGYYTAAITTDGLFEHGYGYYEARCILPKGEGLWGSFWIQSNNMRIPGKDTDGGRNGAEIDIFEAPYYNRGPQLYGCIASSVHTDGMAPLLHSNHIGDFKVEGLYDHFNTFGLEWNENEYIFYINRKETCRTSFLKGTSRVPEYMILSVEVCGDKAFPHEDWAGLITRNTELLPSDFVVDYIHVYDRIPD